MAMLKLQSYCTVLYHLFIHPFTLLTVIKANAHMKHI